MFSGVFHVQWTQVLSICVFGCIWRTVNAGFVYLCFQVYFLYSERRFCLSVFSGVFPVQWTQVLSICVFRCISRICWSTRSVTRGCTSRARRLTTRWTVRASRRCAGITANWWQTSSTPVYRKYSSTGKNIITGLKEGLWGAWLSCTCHGGTCHGGTRTCSRILRIPFWPIIACLIWCELYGGTWLACCNHLAPSMTLIESSLPLWHVLNFNSACGC